MTNRDDQPDTWQSIGSIASGIVGHLAQSRKLDMIATLTAGEIDGWRAEMLKGHRRAFPGETVALRVRARQLGRRA